MSYHCLKDRKGVALLMVFIIMTAVTAIAVGFLLMTATQLRASGADLVSAKALWIAEGGIQHVLYKLDTDSDYRDNPTSLSGNLGDGSYSVSVVKDVNTYAMTSTGTVKNFNRIITQSATVTTAIITSSIHADGSNVNFKDSTGTVNGDISCHVSVSNYSGMTINGTIKENQDKINPSLDFDYYKALAQAAGHYYNSNITFQNATYTGVWYTTKKVTIGSNAIINGSVFAEGTVEFANAATGVQINPANNYPAIAGQGNLSSTGSGNPKIGLQNSGINGLVLIDNNITFDYMVNTTFTGTVIAGGNISMQGGAAITITYDADIFNPMPPGFSFSGGGDVAVLLSNDWDETVPAN